LGRDYDRENWRDLEGTFSEVEAREINSFLMGVWRKLVIAQPGKAFSMYLDNVVTNIGGSMFLLFLFIVAVSSVYYAIYGQSWMAAFLAACTFLHFGNYLFTGIFEPIYPRYGFYTENLQLIGLLATVLWLQGRQWNGRGEAGPARMSE
jgi:hypothetical protein